MENTVISPIMEIPGSTGRLGPAGESDFVSPRPTPAVSNPEV